jgi:hypothetical protein
MENFSTKSSFTLSNIEKQKSTSKKNHPIDIKLLSISEESQQQPKNHTILYKNSHNDIFELCDKCFNGFDKVSGINLNNNNLFSLSNINLKFLKENLKNFDLKTYFSSKIPQEFLCQICKNLLNNPTECYKCKKYFCRECLEKEIEKNGKCFCCKKIIYKNCLENLENEINNIYNKIFLKCPFPFCNEKFSLDVLGYSLENGDIQDLTTGNEDVVDSREEAINVIKHECTYPKGSWEYDVRYANNMIPVFCIGGEDIFYLSSIDAEYKDEILQKLKEKYALSPDAEIVIVK